ncbi:MAG: divalent-cation tolerance protein CutA [Deltaproteobacteria bacterium]|nr:MAG: divalent-cation tolerance protein CutA [Deltaproteobacteria bacterium]
MTAPSSAVAEELARSAVESRLAACVNLLPEVRSIYRWQGKIEDESEVLLVFKTTEAQLEALEQHLIDRHPYDTPEFLALPVAAGAQRYLAWLAAECGP